MQNQIGCVINLEIGPNAKDKHSLMMEMKMALADTMSINILTLPAHLCLIVHGLAVCCLVIMDCHLRESVFIIAA